MARYHRSMSFFFARGALGVAIVAAILGFSVELYSALFGSTLDRDVVTRFGDSIPERLLDPVAGADVSWRGEVSVTLTDPGTSVALLNALPALVVSVAMLVTAWLLLIVVIDVQRGVPFDAKAVRRLRTCAVVIATAAVAYTPLAAWADATVFEAAADHGRMARDANLSPDWFDPMPWLLVAALVAVAAHVFREGRRLADDTEGLV